MVENFGLSPTEIIEGLATFGGVFGLVLSFWAVDLVPTLLSYEDVAVSIDLRVFAFTAAITVTAGILFGIAPALRGSRVDLISALKQGPRRWPRNAWPLGASTGRGPGLSFVCLADGRGLISTNPG